MTNELISKLQALKLKRKPCASALYDTYVVAGWNEAIEACEALIVGTQGKQGAAIKGTKKGIYDK